MKLVLRVVSASLVVVFLGFAGLHLRASGETNRAAGLERAVLALEPGKSTLTDVRKLVDAYGSPGDYGSPCDETLCEISIAPMSFTFFRASYDNTFLRTIGVRPAHYEALILVLNGRVSQAEFGVFYRRRNGSWVRASTSVVDSFTPEEKCLNSGLRRHPEYALLAGNNLRRAGDELVRAGVAVNASAEERRNAQNLDLSCVNSLRECALSDLMPLAYQDWLADLKWKQQNKEQLASEEATCKPQLRPARFVSAFVAQY